MISSKKARENIKEFGKKGETYNDIINKMYKELKLKQSIDVLMNTEGYLTVKEAREWTKNKNKIDSL